MNKYLRYSLWILTVLVITIGSGCKKDSWYVGKWNGEFNDRMHTKYHIQIRNDGTCHVKQEWYWGGIRSADFEAEWEPVSEDVIKIFDYDGHQEVWDWAGQDGRWCRRWSMHLRKDGAFRQDPSGLDNPDGYLIKR